jgi:hypothetical protein
MKGNACLCLLHINNRVGKPNPYLPARLIHHHNSSKLSYDVDNFFGPDEYSVCDSGYSVARTTVPCYKKPYRRPMPEDKAAFNYQLSKLRVVNEHCIDMLKARFQSLRELRILIQDKRDIALICAWFQACCVLHSLLLEEAFDETWLQESEHAAEDIEPETGASMDENPDSGGSSM